MSIATELTTLAANKSAIKAAIEAKSPVTAPTDALSQWPTAIASIPSGPVQQGWIYGYVIDESDSNPATRVSYIEDNANFSPLYMDFTNDALVWGSWQDFVEEYFKPAMLTSAGVIDYYLDPNDLTKKADGVTASDVANTSYDGNAMLIVKPIYYNIGRISPTQIRVRFSNYKQGDDWFNWTHLKSDGTYAEFCGWPLFAGSVVSAKLRSIATGSTPTGNNTATNEYAYATANGSNWYPTTWADEMMFRLLFPLLCKSTNCQAAIGGGASGLTAPTMQCGALKTRGYFYGKANVASSIQYGSKFLGMENVWGEQWRRFVGLNVVSFQCMVKLTPSTIDGSACSGWKTSDNASDYTSNYIASELRYVSSGYSGNTITRMSADCITAMSPTAADGTNYTTYYADMLLVASGVRGVLTAGDCYNATGSGIFATYASLVPSVANIAQGASLSYHFF